MILGKIFCKQQLKIIIFCSQIWNRIESTLTLFPGQIWLYLDSFDSWRLQMAFDYTKRLSLILNWSIFGSMYESIDSTKPEPQDRILKWKIAYLRLQTSTHVLQFHTEYWIIRLFLSSLLSHENTSENCIDNLVNFLSTKLKNIGAFEIMQLPLQ